MKGSWEDLDNEADPGFKRAGSMVDLSAPSEREMEVIRNAVIQHEGLLVSVFDVLRRVPRRVLGPKVERSYKVCTSRCILLSLWH